MLVRTGIAVSDLSGASGGVVAFRNRFGLCFRSRVTPVNPNTDRQVVVKATMAFLAEQWREAPMDAGKRGEWETYAASISWTNRLGESVKLTGFNAFCMCNGALFPCSGGWAANGPGALGLPAQDPLFVASISAAAQKISCVFDDGFDWCDEDFGWLSVQMGLPHVASRNFFGGPWRHAGAIPGSVIAPAASPDATIDCPYTAVEGDRVVVRARIIRADARCSTHFRSVALTVAA